MDPVPVTVLTGFLGSGKTTLLNHILSASHGVRIGVLLNEFGEISIDSRLIARPDDDVLELANGCVCCTMRDDLLRSVAVLLERPRPPEHIVIETTGLADPAPITHQLLDPRIQSDIRLDGVITLVDAANFDRNLECAEQAYSQIVCGDILLINKSDLVAPEVAQKIDAGISLLNPKARTFRTKHARVDLGLILGIGVAHSAPALPDDSVRPHTHVERFRAMTFRTRAAVDLQKFTTLLEEIPREVVRAKGVLFASQVPSRLIFHLVGERWTVTAGEAWQAAETRLTEIVFIGKDFDASARDSLERRLRACTANGRVED